MQKIVSIIIVNYKSEKLIKNCVRSIKTKLPYEIIIIDNNKNNIGYGAGINKGAKQSSSKYLFILNPDTILTPYVIDKLIFFLKKNKKYGIVAPDLTDKNNNLYEFVGTESLTPSSAIFSLSFINKFFPSNPISKKYWIKRNPKKEIKDVKVAPGTAFLIEKKLFEKIGGFDENFFLYFEEADFCKRVINKDYKIAILQTTKITHMWGESTKHNKLNDKYFSESRFYYFKKNYGLIKAIFVNFFINLDKNTFAFLGILTIAAFLRFYRIPQNLDFHGELGDNYLVIKETLGKGILPLLGPPTSHPWLSFGPLFYYIFGPFLILGKYNPIVGAYFWATASMFAIIANYFIVKKLFNIKTALVSSYLLAISPSWLDLARQSRFFSAVAYLFYPLIFTLSLSLKKPKYLFFLGLILGSILNFHLAPIFLIPPMIILFFNKRKNIRRNHIFGLIIGFLVPNTLFIIYNIKTGFSMLTKFAIWIPYRSVIYHNFNLMFTLKTIYDFLAVSILPPQNILGIFSFIAIITSIYFYKKNDMTKILVLFLIFGIAALILHKDPPSHYFFTLYPIPVIFISLFITKINSKFLSISILSLITVSSFVFLFSDKWFYIDENKVMPQTNIPYKLQIDTARKIINDANGKPYNLKRVGFSDEFEKNFAQNYIYLLWLHGNEPKDYKTNLTYTIIEFPDMKIVKTND